MFDGDSGGRIVLTVAVVRTRGARPVQRVIVVGGGVTVLMVLGVGAVDAASAAGQRRTSLARWTEKSSALLLVGACKGKACAAQALAQSKIVRRVGTFALASDGFVSNSRTRIINYKYSCSR